MASNQDKKPPVHKRTVCNFELFKDGVSLHFHDAHVVSLNEYYRMHPGKIARLKQSYRSIMDVLFVNMGVSIADLTMTDKGLVLNRPLFKSAKLTWAVGFKVDRLRDVSNYTQKILLDSIVSSGIFIDDNYKIIYEDRVIHLEGKQLEDTVRLFIEGKIEKDVIGRINLPEESIVDEINKHRFIPLQEDDGEY